jgi:hypothetical protein
LQNESKTSVTRQSDGQQGSRSEAATCKRCVGTGLVCGHEPVVGPHNCCVDYANAICPDCKGSGVQPDADDS